LTQINELLGLHYYISLRRDLIGNGVNRSKAFITKPTSTQIGKHIL